jgi:hypothetical protein
MVGRPMRAVDEKKPAKKHKVLSLFRENPEDTIKSPSFRMNRYFIINPYDCLMKFLHGR